MKYSDFLLQKAQVGADYGFDPVTRSDFLFPFQKELVRWALKKGRSAMFADCGLGKTPMQLAWADNVIRYTKERVLILTPLAVSAQTLREGEKFGIEVQRSLDGTSHPGITVTNYERLHFFDPDDFAGVVCDESSILKNFDGIRKKQITEFIRKVKYRLLCTATAAPNDYIELGTSSEALGYLGHMDMLNRFFKNQNNTSDTKGRWFGRSAPRLWESKQWRFKGHSETPFWRWVCSWARAMRKPSDFGFEDGDFILTPLKETQHLIESRTRPPGMLFSLPAVGLQEQRAERRRTIQERCEKVAELVSDTGNSALVWCHLNDEGDLLEKLISDAVQVAGRHLDNVKEERLLGFQNGDFRVLITKPKIGAWGLNFQHCSHITFFPTHSFESYYQGIRRCWRFGQNNPVKVDVVTTEGEKNILDNLQRKAKAAERMFDELIRLMNNQLNIKRDRKYPNAEVIPEWL